MTGTCPQNTGWQDPQGPTTRRTRNRQEPNPETKIYKGDLKALAMDIDGREDLT